MPRAFQSPSLRGSGRFAHRLGRCVRRGRVSIPFIAGQWSLLRIARRAGESGPGRFNPLHCGAVVASGARRSIRRIPRRVSIPFIAGQWSLLGAAFAPFGGGRFQSPSLRGSGRFLRAAAMGYVLFGVFQSPSLRGSGRFFARFAATSSGTSESFNPLHCGAVVASCVPSPGRRRRGCWRFNPLHCGAVVASAAAGSGRSGRGGGFNPLHCGAVVASIGERLMRICDIQVSIPFIAGQWSLPIGANGDSVVASGFNPLHCGAVVASRGIGPPAVWQEGRFNPLHCGAVVASLNGTVSVVQ